MADNMNIETTILRLLKSVKELKEANEQLMEKVKAHEEKNEIISGEIRKLKTDITLLECDDDAEDEDDGEDAVSKKEMCEHIEEVISSIYPLRDGWRAVYSEEQECMGYYDDSDRLYNEPPPNYLFWDRSQFMKKTVITIS